MNPMPDLTPMLKQLRLSGILDSIEVRNRQAIEHKLSYMDFLATIVTDEIARRNQRKLATALRRANFRNRKTLEEFDFSYNPNINRALVMDLASCRFMAEKVGVFSSAPAAPVRAIWPGPRAIAPSGPLTACCSPRRPRCSPSSTPLGRPTATSATLPRSPEWTF
jgi:hypothetical protein